MTRQPSRKHWYEAEDFLHNRGLTASSVSASPIVTPGGAPSLGPAPGPTGPGFTHRTRGWGAGPASVPSAAMHSEQPGHRHRGAERHSAH